MEILKTLLSKISPKLLQRINPISAEESSKAQAAVIGSAIAVVEGEPILAVAVIVIWIIVQGVVDYAKER